MIERIPCEFFLIRYVPNVVTAEFVNIGVFLRETLPAPGKVVTAEARFTNEWGRVLLLHPDADIELLESLADEISARVRDESAVDHGIERGESILDVMQESFSNSIQLSELHHSLANTFSEELERLMLMYVEPQIVG